MALSPPDAGAPRPGRRGTGGPCGLRTVAPCSWTSAKPVIEVSTSTAFVGARLEGARRHGPAPTARILYNRSPEVTMRTALYARVSTTDQTTANQLIDLRQYVTARGWQHAVEYVDESVSGSRLVARKPVWSDLVVPTPITGPLQAAAPPVQIREAGVRRALARAFSLGKDGDHPVGVGGGSHRPTRPPLPSRHDPWQQLPDAPPHRAVADPACQPRPRLGPNPTATDTSGGHDDLRLVPSSICPIFTRRICQIFGRR